MDRALVRDALEREHTGFELIEVSNNRQLEKLLSEQKFDLILSDFNILGYEGLQIIDFVKNNYPDTPVIIVTGTGSEEIAVEAMKRSANDYIIKSPGHIKKLPESIKKTVQANRSRLIQNILYQILQAILNTENLTDFIALIREELKRLIDTTNFFVALYNEQTNSFTVPFYADTYDHVEDFPAEKTISHYVVKTQKSLVAGLDDLIKLEKQGLIRRIGAVSLIWMGIPLKVGDRVIGVMVVQSYTDENAFTQSDLELLEIISAPVSMAIQKKQATDKLESANRELLQLNDRLQKANRELQALNDEINNLLNSTDLAVLYLDKELRIRKYTPAMERLMKLNKTDIGRSLPEATLDFPELQKIELINHAQKVLKNLMPAEKEVQGSGEHYFLQRIHPFYTGNKQAEGVTICFIDISERKKIELELKKHKEHLEDIVRERTQELEKKNQELENFNRLFIGREFRIKELKDQIEELKRKLNQE